MASIETGVDKLVSLVASEKKIELEAAAKKLSIDPTVVKEWADFLEEEGIIGIQFSLSKTFLVEKRLSGSEVKKKASEYENKREAFVRRVDSALKQLEDETAGFESIKKQYDAVKDQIGDEIEAVKEEMDQLRHYEQLKKSMDHDILKQKIEYQKSIEEIRERLHQEEKRYAKIIEEVTQEEKKIEADKTEFDDIKKEEGDLAKRIDALQSIIKSVHSRLESNQKSVEAHEERLTTLRELAHKLRQDIVEKREKEIDPMLKVSDDQSGRIMRIQEEMVNKIKAQRSKMAEFENQASEITERFQKYFDKRSQTEKLIKELEEIKHQMRDSLEELIRKAKAFDVTVKGADASRHVKKLETDLRDFEKSKSQFSDKLDRLKSFIMGKGHPKISDQTSDEPTVSVKPKKKKSKKKSSKTAKKKR